MDKRSRNFMESEKYALLDIVAELSNVVENKKTDATTCDIKKKAWDAITVKYNALASTGPRSSKQLKSLYDLMKKKARQNTSADKVGKNIFSFMLEFCIYTCV
jgi:hypothetical protein